MFFVHRLAAVALSIGAVLVAPAGQAQAAAPVCKRVQSDFNGDGYADLAVGEPDRFDELYDTTFAGGIRITYGSRTGLTTGTHADFFDPTSPGLPGDLRGSTAGFGNALASGYFDADCFADLAVGASRGGDVLIMYGSIGGIGTHRSHYFHGTSLAPDVLPDGGSFGEALATGDFNGDGADDLAVGAPSADDTRGTVGVLYGARDGLSAVGVQWFTQNTPGVPGAAERSDYFGDSLAAADMTGDGRAELAIGASSETLSGKADAGGVVVLRGTAAGLTGKGAQWWDQDVAGVPGAAERGDWFGYRLAARDLTGDGRAELVIASPMEGLGRKTGAGAVTVLYGSPSGPTAKGAQIFHKDTTGVPATAKQSESFGSALALGDFNGDGWGDLAVGSPDTNPRNKGQAGAVHVLYGRRGGLSGSGAKLLDQETPGVPGASEGGDLFGVALRALAGFNGRADALVVGASGESVGARRQDGAFTVLPGGKSGVTGAGGVLLSGANLPGGAVDGAALGRAFG